ncbi:TATA box-binding protein-associated factor RNA polymerase I subunit B [Lucilia cuprina]|uniref:TATA box-binding protein-associated factor RNA polymerase I subunit B n=1 Tax=Lucilia cuprina TaxID=7375 RepID=UPI001F0642E0|nr:TATA box-binding protein-associated factor RNA polymerase I subunit B [Lucilia cuprina]
MEQDDTTLPINSNIKCHVCGENQFEEREGFYYCQECGTKQEQVRLVEVNQDDEFTDKLKAKKLKIQVAQAERPQLTSWECYNYILRGFVEELLSIGAKEELKLMTLQVWAAYLRRMEVAFFNRKQADLPKLGIKYLQNDAETIYNHSKAASKKRQRRRSEGTSCTSGDESRSTAKDWRKNKRKLDESIYSLTSGTSATSATSGLSGFTSSTSAYSNRAIRIGFNMKARSYFKKTMSKKHLEKHAVDSEGKLKCHRQPNARKINRTDYSLMVMNIKQIYSVLAIALNLIGDEIQLCDLVRFINEGHISTANVLQYFPENIANYGREMLKKINFYKCPDKYSDKCLRDHSSIICKNIGIRALKQPDIVKLVRRYIAELCLPIDIGDYIERLINLLPPQFESRTLGFYPGYEARAMAYIIFTLKLLFGLDGSNEYRISQTTQKLNMKIKDLNFKKNENQPQIFVWTEWVEYIEMRKIIVSQFSSAFCEQFKQCQSTSQLMEQMAEDIRKTEDINNLLNDTTDNSQSKQKLKNFRSLFERFQESYKIAENIQKPVQLIEFKPTFTPGLTYFKHIFLLYDRDTDNTMNLEIPDFMRIDHAQRNINCYLQVKPLIAYFKKHHLKLKVHALATNNNNNYVGVFRASRNVNNLKIKVEKACFEITEEEWIENIKDDVAHGTDDLLFVTGMKTYPKFYFDQIKSKSKRMDSFNPTMNYDLTMIYDDTDNESDNENISNRSLSKPVSKLTKNNNNDDLQSMHSFELFSENNMDPIDNQDFIVKPRRNLENVNLFEGISDDESVINEDDDDDNSKEFNDDDDNIMDSNVERSGPGQLKSFTIDSSSKRPIICEEFIKVEPDEQDSEENDKNIKCNDLKFYITKMDYWLLIGNIQMLTKGQKTQLQDKFPRSFNWLLETCAQTINVEWSAVYEQLLCIELMFCLGIKDPNTIKNCVYINGNNQMKEIQTLINTYREVW